MRKITYVHKICFSWNNVLRQIGERNFLITPRTCSTTIGLGFKHQTFRMRGESSNQLHHRRALSSVEKQQGESCDITGAFNSVFGQFYSGTNIWNRLDYSRIAYPNI